LFHSAFSNDRPMPRFLPLKHLFCLRQPLLPVQIVNEQYFGANLKALVHFGANLRFWCKWDSPRHKKAPHTICWCGESVLVLIQFRCRSSVWR